MPQEEKKQDPARDRILRISANLFRDHGYAGVSMRKIAEACEMKAGSLYYHFSSKEQILSEVLNIGIERVHTAVENALSAVPEDASAADQLKAAISGHLHALLEHSAFTSANVRIFGQVPANVRESNLQVRRAYEDLWDRFLQSLQDQGKLRGNVNVRSFRLMLIGALNASLEWFDSDKGDVAGLAERYAGMLAHGVMAEDTT